MTVPPSRVAVLGLLFGSLAFWPGRVARAADDVRASVTVTASAEEVLRLLADHRAALSICPDVRAVRVVHLAADGCADLEVETTGLVNPMRYSSRRCPSGTGYREVLVRSEDFSENTFTWSVRDEGGARVVTLSVRSVPRLPVPDWILERAVQRSVEATVANLAARLPAAGAR
jgi:hypothetical protein